MTRHARARTAALPVGKKGRRSPNRAAVAVEPDHARLLEALPAAVYTCDAKGRVRFYNEAAVALLGRAPEIGKTLWWGSHRIYRPDGTALALDRCPMALTLREGRGRRGAEIVVERPDGTRRHVLANPEPILDATGAVVGAINTLVDITERKQADAELAATQQDLRRQVDSLTRLHDLACGLSHTRELRPALQAILETAVDLHGADFGLLWLHEPSTGRFHEGASVGFDAPSLAALAGFVPGANGGKGGSAFGIRQQAVTDTETDPRLERHRPAARKAGFRAVHSTPILTRTGQVLGVLSVLFRKEHRRPTEREVQLSEMCALHAADAIESARSQQVLRDSEERFRTMADHAPMMVWVTEADGACSFLSRSWYDFTGLDPGRSLGRGWIEPVHPDDRKAAADRLRPTSGRFEASRLEYRLRRSDGEYRWVIDAAVPRRDPGGRFLGYIGSVMDITDRKAAEDALREADRRKDEFLATLAHELRNPLAPLCHGLEILRLGPPDPRRVQEVRELVERQLQQMVRLIDDLLDLSRISLGRIELRKERINLSVVVKQALETSRPLIDKASHELSLTLPPDPVFVDADSTRLAQVFANLLNNAARYTPRSGRIGLSVERQGPQVTVRVKDTGIGIPGPMLPRVFDMFAHVDRPLGRSSHGLGIGLSIVKRLVEMHHGLVEARSAGPGAGSEFVVRLPVASPEASSALVASPEAPVSPARRWRVLVADDNLDAATSLARMLTLMSYDVRTAHDGLEAVEVAASFRPRLILLDIGMPGLDGYETCARLRKQCAPGVVIVALTGWGQDEARRRSKEGGFDHHLVKPLQPGELRALLATWEGRHREPSQALVSLGTS